MSNRFIAYYRCSTIRQGQSGLGLEAQERAVAMHVGGNELVRAYTEVETGKKDDLENRPQLRNAIAHARRAKATLIVAKMDRLARSSFVTVMLQKSGVDF